MSDSGSRARSHAHGQRHGRFAVHGVLLLLAFTAVVVAVRNPLNTNAVSLPIAPSFAFSGVVGATQAGHDSYLRPLASQTTLTSTIQNSPTSDLRGLRAASAIEPASSFSSGVMAAGGAGGDTGVTALADSIDPRRPFTLYTTKPGDTLGLISQRFGRSVDTILDNNPTVTDANAIELGQQILIPRDEGILHVVSHGETLADIIDQYDDVTIDAVLEYRPNDIVDADDISSGQYVLLPNAKVKPPPPPPPVTSPGGTGNPGNAPEAGNGLFDYPLGAGAWTMVSDSFGVWRGPGRTHTGIDLAGVHSAPVYSSCEGVVIKAAWWTYSYGYHVVVDCGGGWTTVYAHFSNILVVEGQYVNSGTQIGVTGSTGYSTGEHLHFEIRLSGAYYDPAAYLPNLYP